MNKCYEISIGIFFKRCFCKNCGKRLIIKNTKRIINKTDKEYKSWGRVGATRYFYSGPLTIIGKCYFCPTCNYEIDYDDQLHINRMQKKLKRKVLTEEECKHLPKSNKYIESIKKFTDKNNG